MCYTIKFFHQYKCPNCVKAERVLDSLDMKYESFSLDSPDGLAEAQFFNILATPTIIVSDEHDKEILSWRGIIPDKDTMIKSISKTFGDD